MVQMILVFLMAILLYHVLLYLAHTSNDNSIASFPPRRNRENARGGKKAPGPVQGQAL
jgi:hypothetical protein